MTNLILFGPPGSGKGTQAALLVTNFQFTHISTGDMFRKEIREETALGKEAVKYLSKGQLVPDELTIRMLKNEIELSGPSRGVIFDGFPRTENQAVALDLMLSNNGENISALIRLEVPEDEIIQRILDRGKTSGRRDDQDVEIIRHRINLYEKETEKVYNYYAKKGVAYSIDGLGTIEEIFERIKEVVIPVDEEE